MNLSKVYFSKKKIRCTTNSEGTEGGLLSPLIEFIAMFLDSHPILVKLSYETVQVYIIVALFATYQIYMLQLHSFPHQ